MNASDWLDKGSLDQYPKWAECLELWLCEIAGDLCNDDLFDQASEEVIKSLHLVAQLRDALESAFRGAPGGGMSDIKPGQMAVTLAGQMVTIKIRLRDHYEAIALYDKAIACAGQGRLNLSFDGVTEADSPEGGAADGT